MQIGKVIGTVVSTVKTGRVQGLPLLIVQPLDENLKDSSKAIVCTDTVNAKHGEIVLVCSSSSARCTDKTRGACTDSSIVAIVDAVSYGKHSLYLKNH